MIRLEQSITIARPPDEVFAYIADPCRDPEWNDPILEARLTSEGPVGVGTTFHYVVEFLGRRFTASGQVMEYVPNERACVRTTGGPLRSTGCRKVEPAPSGARVVVTVEGEAGGPFRLAEGLAARAARRQLDAALAKLKIVLESGTGQ